MRIQKQLQSEGVTYHRTWIAMYLRYTVDPELRAEGYKIVIQ